MASEPPSERTTVRRRPQRGAYDRATIDAILDAGVLCHVAYVLDGAPVVTPTLYWREGDHVYWHGSSASRMLRASDGADVCLAVSHLDGLVLARSGFNHSANYRSVMLFGRARAVTDPAAAERHLERFVEGLVPGRWAQLRPPTAQEVRATTVLSLPIDEASAKVRSGGPHDDEADYDWPVWAGVVPVRTVAGPPEPDERLANGLSPPEGLGPFPAHDAPDA